MWSVWFVRRGTCDTTRVLRRCGCGYVYACAYVPAGAGTFGGSVKDGSVVILDSAPTSMRGGKDLRGSCCQEDAGGPTYVDRKVQYEHNSRTGFSTSCAVRRKGTAPIVLDVQYVRAYRSIGVSRRATVRERRSRCKLSSPCVSPLLQSRLVHAIPVCSRDSQKLVVQSISVA
jgi:hypothetical protein